MPNEEPKKENLGRLGENAAAEYLKERGYQLLKRNYKRGRGEIDLIMTFERYLVFAEVKTRREGYLVSPLQAVTNEKQARILLTAQQYLAEYPCDLQPRFDVIEVLVPKKGSFSVKEITHWENAFTA